MDALTLFKSDMEVFIRVYAFLSQIFDYQTTAIEKRAIFFRRLVPLLDFGREREGVDLSKVVLTHHKLTSKGKAALSPDQSEGGKLKPLLDTGTGQVHDPEKVRLDEIIQRVNDLFEGDLTEEHRVKFYQTVEAAILASETLARQAQNNSEEQFGNSPDLRPIVTDAVIEAHSSFAEMSRQYLNDPGVQDGLIAALLKPGALWSKLQGRAAG
jgi:type I restriction enzyme, R subunit